MVLKLKPLADRLVVEPTEQEEMTASGIYVPETAKEKPQKGKVIAAGPGRKDDDGKRIPMDVAEGDRVKRGQRLLVLEAMKMQHEVQAGVDGIVSAICREAGAQVAAGELVLEIEPAEPASGRPE